MSTGALRQPRKFHAEEVVQASGEVVPSPSLDAFESGDDSYLSELNLLERERCHYDLSRGVRLHHGEAVPGQAMRGGAVARDTTLGPDTAAGKASQQHTDGLTLSKERTGALERPPDHFLQTPHFMGEETDSEQSEVTRLICDRARFLDSRSRSLLTPQRHPALAK